MHALVLGAAAVAAVTFASPVVAADPYPVKPIRIVVPFAAGGSTDILARHVGQRLTELMKVSVVVDNRPGGGAVIGAEHVARSAPDGYTLLMGTNTTHSTAPYLYRKLPFDPLRDFVAVTEVANNPQFLDVHPSIPVRSVKELIALARARPGQLNYGSAGAGSASHMAMELFRSTAKIDLVHVPYKGTGPAMTELIGGHLSMMFDVVLTTLPHMRSGKVRVLGVSSLKRVEVAPEVPTIAENGLPGFEALVWFGLFAPAATPPEIVARLSRELMTVMRDTRMREMFASQALTPGGAPPAEFAAMVKADNAKWGRVIREAGIKLD